MLASTTKTFQVVNSKVFSVSVHMHTGKFTPAQKVYPSLQWQDGLMTLWGGGGGGGGEAAAATGKLTHSLTLGPGAGEADL